MPGDAVGRTGPEGSPCFRALSFILLALLEGTRRFSENSKPASACAHHLCCTGSRGWRWSGPRKPMRQASSRFLPGTDATLDTAGDICWPGDVVGLQDMAAHWTHCRRGQRPHGSHSGWRGPWRRSCWHRPIPANPADIPRAGVSHGRLASACSSLPLERYPKGSRLPEFPNPGVCLRSLGVRLSAAGPVEMRLLPHGGGAGSKGDAEGPPTELTRAPGTLSPGQGGLRPPH